MTFVSLNLDMAYNNKYNLNERSEVLNRALFMMNYDSRKTLTENKEFLPMIEEGYVFDFVITEDEKYLIWADNLISKELGFIGNIWENTWVINKIIKENYKTGANVIEESVLDSIRWTKDLFLESLSLINDDELINEQWDWIKNKAKSAWSGVKKVGSAIASGAAELAKKALMNGFLPALRWIRRNIYTTAGTVIDVVTAMIPVTTAANKIVWAMIVILDVFEIISGNFDPDEVERQQDPYSGLLIDLISFAFAAAAGLTAKTAMRAAKAGKPMSGFLKNTLTKLTKSLPGISSSLSSFGNLIIKHIPGAKTIVTKVISGFNSIIKGVDKFISQLFSKQGATAVVAGVGVGLLTRPIVLGIGDTGDDVSGVNKYLKEIHNSMYPACKVDVTKIPNGNTFTKETENAAKRFATCFNSDPETGKYEKLRTDGKLDNGGLMAMGLQMDERGITKYIPPKAKELMGRAAKQGSDFLKKNLSKVVKKPTA